MKMSETDDNSPVVSSVHTASLKWDMLMKEFEQTMEEIMNEDTDEDE